MEGETLACLVIDDPLLWPRYGCLDYSKLLQEMKDHRFFTEIAFIPWNYRRSDKNTIRLFGDNPEYLSICVHGCNHLSDEFGKGSYQELSTLASTALWRMEQHKRLTGLSYDPVFVFPQGRFSSIAMQALKDQGYLAAFNSTLRATDGGDLPAIEYEQAATRKYHDFPLFLRRYPKDKSDFIKDIALGRPILIVEHHGSFQYGYKPMTDLVDWINSLGNIRWTSLLNLAEHHLGEKASIIQNIANPSPISLRLSTKIISRRVLSEFRDNYVEKSNILNNVYKFFRK